MAIYQYKGRDAAGNEINGELEAANEGVVASVLSGQHIIAVAIKEISTDKTENFKLFSKQKITLDELVMLCRQIYSLLKAGVPTVQAINGLALSARNPALSRSLMKLEQSMETGTPLAGALRQQPEVYNALFVAMVHVGENTGRLDEAFKRLSGYLELERTTRQRIKQATRYPKMVVGAISVALVIINMFVIPQFANLFSKFGSELPLPTKILIATSDFFQNYWGLLLFGLLAGSYALVYYKNTAAGHLRWDGFLLKLPVFGPIFEKITLGRFARTFAMTYSAGVPILQSLAVVAKAVSNKYVEKAVLGMRSGIERGDSFTRTATAAGLFSPLVLQMISVGEQTGSLDDLLNEVGDFYEQEVDYDLSLLSDAIQPILLVFIGIMVLILALGVFLPMWDMYSLFANK